MEITKREIIFSISIVALLLIVGVLISNKLTELRLDANEKYNKSVQIDDSELFIYGMDTNVGNAFVYGNLEAVEPITHSRVKGEYLVLKEVKERYTKHTKKEVVTENGKKVTKTVTYWSWDTIGKEYSKSSKVIFCNVEFSTSQFILPHESYISTVKESSKIRYKYYGVPAKSKGTIFTTLQNGGIEKSGVVFYMDKDIESTYKTLTSGGYIIIFWTFWIGLISYVVYYFYYAENSWLR